jgi:hypothetical protein
MLFVFWLAWFASRMELPQADRPDYSPARALQMQLAREYPGPLIQGIRPTPLPNVWGNAA